MIESVVFSSLEHTIGRVSDLKLSTYVVYWQSGIILDIGGVSGSQLCAIAEFTVVSSGHTHFSLFSNIS